MKRTGTWRPDYSDGPLDHLPPDLAKFVERLRREEKYDWHEGADWDDPIVADQDMLDELAATSELGRRLRAHIEAWSEANAWVDELLFGGGRRPS